MLADRYRTKRNWLSGTYSVRTFRGHTQHISCLQFDAKRIVSGSSDRTIRVWDLRTNTQSTRTLEGHSGTVRCLQFDDEVVVSGSDDATIRVWDICTGACKAILRGCARRDHARTLGIVWEGRHYNSHLFLCLSVSLSLFLHSLSLCHGLFC